MALEAVAFPQGLLHQSPLTWNYNLASVVDMEEPEKKVKLPISFAPKAESTGRRKRQRTKTHKNMEEVENQRMAHIVVERNRRKQMNDYLAVIRSLMPSSYVQKGDQASIIGGAINFVKDLEKLLQSLDAQKQFQMPQTSDFGAPFANFFTFPQYSTSAFGSKAVVDIEASLVESHAHVKVFSRQRPKQLLRLVLGLQSKRLSPLHLNVTTVHPMILYSFSLKVEEDCRLRTVDEIANAVHQMLVEIEKNMFFQIY